MLSKARVVLEIALLLALGMITGLLLQHMKPVPRYQWNHGYDKGYISGYQDGYNAAYKYYVGNMSISEGGTVLIPSAPSKNLPTSPSIPGKTQ